MQGIRATECASWLTGGAAQTAGWRSGVAGWTGVAAVLNSLAPHAALNSQALGATRLQHRTRQPAYQDCTRSQTPRHCQTLSALFVERAKRCMRVLQSASCRRGRLPFHRCDLRRLGRPA